MDKQNMKNDDLPFELKIECVGATDGTWTFRVPTKVEVTLGHPLVVTLYQPAKGLPGHPRWRENGSVIFPPKVLEMAVITVTRVWGHEENKG
jgi:hypothetical protein